MDSLLSNLLGGLKLLPLLALGILALLIGYVVMNECLRRKSMIPGLASPPQNIVFGHLPYFAHKGVAEPCREWSKAFGPVYQIKLGNITAVTVNTAAAAKHIFSHQSHATSSRPELFTLHKVCSRYVLSAAPPMLEGFYWIHHLSNTLSQLVNNASGTPIGQTPYSDSLKRRRRAAAAALNRPMVQTYVSNESRH